VEDDEMIPDKESDIKPRFHRARRHSMGRSGDEVGIVLCWQFTEILLFILWDKCASQSVICHFTIWFV